MFETDNLFNRFMTKIFDLVVLNFLWMLLCLPIVTAGAATIALHTMTLKMIRNEEPALLKGFFGAFKANIKASLPATGLLAVWIGAGGMMLHIIGESTESLSSLSYGILIVILALAGLVFVWLFPLMAFFDNTFGRHLNNAWRLAVTQPAETLLMFGMFVVPWMTMLVPSIAAYYLLGFYLLIGFAGCAYLSAYFLRKRFDTL